MMETLSGFWRMKSGVTSWLPQEIFTLRFVQKRKWRSDKRNLRVRSSIIAFGRDDPGRGKLNHFLGASRRTRPAASASSCEAQFSLGSAGDVAFLRPQPQRPSRRQFGTAA